MVVSLVLRKVVLGKISEARLDDCKRSRGCGFSAQNSRTKPDRCKAGSFRELNTAQTGPRARIAIIYNPEKDPELPYLGIHMQDIPRAYLAEADSMESGNDEGLSKYLMARVDDEQLERVIPDLDKIISDLKREFNPGRLEELKA